MLWLLEQFPSYIRFNDIVKTHLSFNGIVRMLYTSGSQPVGRDTLPGGRE